MAALPPNPVQKVKIYPCNMRAAGDETDSEDELDFLGAEEDDYFEEVASKNFENEEISSRLPPFRSNARENKNQRTFVECQNYEEFRIAVMNGNLDSVKDFVRNGININEPLKSGWSALMYACSAGHHILVDYFLENKADPNENKDGYTPLMAACASTKSTDDLVKCVVHLLNNGADVNISQKQNMTALMFAAKGGREKIIKLLIKHGAEIEASDNQGWTALCWAAHHGHGNVVKALIEANADPKHPGDHGETAIELALQNGFHKIADILKNLQEINTDSDARGDAEEKNDSASYAQKIQSPKKKVEDVLNELSKSLSPKVSSLGLSTTRKFQKYGDLEMFLAGLQLSDILPLFQEHQITFPMLLTLDEDELIKIGIHKLGVRRAILDAIRDIHKKEWSNTSIPIVRDKRHITCPEAYAIVANIAKHLSFIESTTVYLHKQSKLNPEDLEKGKNDVTIKMLLKETDNSIVTLNKLERELLNFRSHLNKLESRVEHIPVGILRGEPKFQRKITPIIPICLVGVMFLGIFYFKPNRAPAITSALTY